MGPGEQVSEDTLRKMSRAAEQVARAILDMLKGGHRTLIEMMEQKKKTIQAKLANVLEAKNPQKAMEDLLLEQARRTKNQLAIAFENGQITKDEYTKLLKDVDDLKAFDGDMANASAQYAAMACTEARVEYANNEFARTGDAKVYDGLTKESAEYMRVPQVMQDKEKLKSMLKDPEFKKKYDDIINMRKSFLAKIREKIKINKMKAKAENKGKIFESRTSFSEKSAR